jgi:hypothetical protein
MTAAVSAVTKIGPLHAPGIFEIHDDQHRIVGDTNPYTLNDGDEEPISDELAEAYAKLFAEAPAMKLALDLIAAGVASIVTTTPPGFASFQEFIFDKTHFALIGDHPWTKVINLAGWSQAREALAKGRGV